MCIMATDPAVFLDVYQVESALWELFLPRQGVGATQTQGRRQRAEGPGS